MMSKEKRRVPKLRFPGFTEDWEQRELAELCNVYDGTHQTPRYTNSGVMFVSVENIKTLESDKYISEDDFKNEFKIFPEFGDILLTRIGDVGSANIILDNIKRAYYVSLALLKPKGVNSLFLLALLSSASVQSEIWKRTLHIAFPKKINKNEISKVIVSKPSILEQKKIGELIYVLDQIITLHQRKLDNLKLKKKALLQKLFPKNGERYPELRFPGFTDAWEQRKLGDFYTFKNGLNKEKVYFGYGDSIVNFTDVFHNRQIYSSTLKGKVFVNKKELENFKVKEGDLFFTRTSETIDEIGFPAVVMEPMERVVFSGFVLRGRAEKNDPLVNIFKSYIFFTDNFRSEMKKKSSMTTRALTSGTALKEMYFSYPKDLEEQTKIGEILLRLDNVITLHQRKLDHLQLQKKALLQQMFV